MLDRILNELRHGPKPSESLREIAIGTEFEHSPTEDLVKKFGPDAVMTRRLMALGLCDLETTIAQDLSQ